MNAAQKATMEKVKLGAMQVLGNFTKGRELRYAANGVSTGVNNKSLLVLHRMGYLEFENNVTDIDPNVWYTVKAK